jgi:hypothetical protein
MDNVAAGEERPWRSSGEIESRALAWTTLFLQTTSRSTMSCSAVGSTPVTFARCWRRIHNPSLLLMASRSLVDTKRPGGTASCLRYSLRLSDDQASNALIANSRLRRADDRAFSGS